MKGFVCPKPFKALKNPEDLRHWNGFKFPSVGVPKAVPSLCSWDFHWFTWFHILSASDVFFVHPNQSKLSLGGGFKYFYFHPYLGKWSNFTNIFQMGWSHKLEIEFWVETSWTSNCSDFFHALKKLSTATDLVKYMFQSLGKYFLFGLKTTITIIKPSPKKMVFSDF